MKSYRTDRQDRPSSRAESILFYSIIYNRKDWDYTLSRNPPRIKKKWGHWEETQRKSCRKSSKCFLEWDTKEGQIRKLFCKAHLGKRLGCHPRAKGLTPFFSLHSQQFHSLLRNELLLKILFGKGKNPWLKTVRPVAFGDCHLFQCGMPCVFFTEW